jgi:hypothetical protein
MMQSNLLSHFRALHMRFTGAVDILNLSFTTRIAQTRSVPFIKVLHCSELQNSALSPHLLLFSDAIVTIFVSLMSKC